MPQFSTIKYCMIDFHKMPYRNIVTEQMPEAFGKNCACKESVDIHFTMPVSPERLLAIINGERDKA